jgi:hypothetical protein
MTMLEGVTELTLAFLNEATQAWMEIEDNRAVHRETASTYQPQPGIEPFSRPGLRHLGGCRV